jgi:hypothetical protein
MTLAIHIPKHWHGCRNVAAQSNGRMRMEQLLSAPVGKNIKVFESIFIPHNGFLTNIPKDHDRESQEAY